MANKIKFIAVLFILSFLSYPAFSQSGSSVIDLNKDTDPYMYLYCKKSPNNPYCQRQFAKHFYVHSLMRNKNPMPTIQDESSLSIEPFATNSIASVSQTQDTAPEIKPAPIKPKTVKQQKVVRKAEPKKVKKIEIARAKTEAQTRPKPVQQHVGTEPSLDPEAINSKSYLVSWIRDMYNIELNWNEYSEAELADLYSRLMWCSTIQNDLGERCDYMNSSTEELRARYEASLSF